MVPPGVSAACRSPNRACERRGVAQSPVVKRGEFIEKLGSLDTLKRRRVRSFAFYREELGRLTLEVYPPQSGDRKARPGSHGNVLLLLSFASIASQITTARSGPPKAS